MAPIEASSPCACGCIYVVNNERKVDITSGEECPTLPISWTVKVHIEILGSEIGYWTYVLSIYLDPRLQKRSIARYFYAATIRELRTFFETFLFIIFG